MDGWEEEIALQHEKLLSDETLGPVLIMESHNRRMSMLFVSSRLSLALNIVCLLDALLKPSPQRDEFMSAVLGIERLVLFSHSNMEEWSNILVQSVLDVFGKT